MTTRSLYIDISQDPALSKVARSEVAAATVAPREMTGQPDGKNIVINTNVETTKVYVKETFNLPGGSNSQVQINQGGQFSGDPGLTYNAQTDTLRTGSLIVTDNLTISGTANFGTTLVGYATETYVSDFVNQEIAGLINSAPGTLDTLGEIATTVESLQQTIESLQGQTQFNQSLNTSDNVQFGSVRSDGLTVAVDNPYLFEVMVTQPDADVPPVYFTRRNNHPTDVDQIAPGLTIKRNQGGGAIFNSEQEANWNGGVSPAGTRWNADGWADLTNIHTRTYTDFQSVFGNYNIGEIVTHKYLVMHDTINDQYWAIKFEWWQPGNGGGSGGTLDGKGGFNYTRYLIDTVNGFVRFVRLSTDDNTVGDSIGPGVNIVRDSAGGIYNSEEEGSWDPDTSPTGTLWNDDGWNDLSRVGDRNFYPLYTAVHGQLGNHLVGRELVMWDQINNKYYTVKFTDWGSNNGGSFAYVRRELINTTNQTGLRFPDYSVQKTAYIPYKNLVLDDETGTISVVDGSDLNIETTADYGVNSDININSTGSLWMYAQGGETTLLSTQGVSIGAGDSQFLDWWWPGSNVQWNSQTLTIYCPPYWSPQYAALTQYLTNTYDVQFRTLDNVWHNTWTTANATYDTETQTFSFAINANNTTGSTLEVNIFRYRDLNYQGTEWWNFNRDGTLELPNNSNNTAAIQHRNTFTRASEGWIDNTGGVIWTSREDWITSVKLNIQIEVAEVGGDGAWHTQICDAVIAKRSNNTSDPIMTVYAVTHTSVDILATFTVQRNVTTNKIEVIATPTAAAVDNGLQYRIHAVEFGTRD